MKSLVFITLSVISVAALNTPAFAWSEWVSYGGKPKCEAHEGSTTQAGTYKDQKCGQLAFQATAEGVLVRHRAAPAGGVKK